MENFHDFPEFSRQILENSGKLWKLFSAFSYIPNVFGFSKVQTQDVVCWAKSLASGLLGENWRLFRIRKLLKIFLRIYETFQNSGNIFRSFSDLSGSGRISNSLLKVRMLMIWLNTQDLVFVLLKIQIH
jgi:hypothetical protein